MHIVSRLIFLVFFGLIFLGLNSVALAKDKDNGKCPTVYCPKVQFVCKPCKKGKNPPTSTCNPKDICCSFEIVGWYDCSPKNGKCSNPKVSDSPWQIEDNDQSRDDNDKNDKNDKNKSDNNKNDKNDKNNKNDKR